MNGVTAVLNKEITNYFRSPIAYFIVAVFLLGTGYFFIDNVFLRGSASMDTTLQNMGILLIVVVPAISMRLFSAEYNGRTIELLMTLPLQKWEIVL
ncbi:MAG TPA: ABC transporter permease, partial [Betaproteobacteria bacterium]|nr:ABC transporter permease [Betaproteobacteria bacterium]